MGMFDSAYAKVKCPICNKEEEVEIQFKTYLGKYSPACKRIRIGESIKGFPKISRYIEQGDICFKCSCWDWEKHKDIDYSKSYCLLVFIKGILSEIVFPIPDNDIWPTFPSGKNSYRRQLFKDELQKRYNREHEGESIGESLLAPFKHGMDYCAIGRMILNEGPYPNHFKTNGKWERNPYAKY